MILNEDYFDNIDITDDDLNTDSESELNTNDNRDAKTLITDMFSSYKQCMRFRFQTPYSRKYKKHGICLTKRTNGIFSETL